MKRIDPDDFFKAVIGEAEVALRRKNFQAQVRHIHLIMHIMEERIRRFEDEQFWSEVERVFQEFDRD